MKKPLVTTSFCLALLVACGGGGGGGSSSNNSGSSNSAQAGISAADGAAMAYGVVSINSLVDNTTYSGTADISGYLSIPTSGVTYPAIVKAQSLSGNKVNYGYITSSSQTNVPVNPISTLILSIASSGNPATITSTNQLSPTSIATAKTAVNTIFSNIFQAFAVSSSTDLLTTNFPTNHTGLDFILDALNVKFDALGNPTVCTKLLNTCKTLNLSNLDTTAISITQNEINSLTSAPIATCSNSIKAFTSTSLTTDTSIYASDFLNSGLDAAGYRQAMSSRLGNLSANFNNPTFIGTDPNNNFVFAFDYFNSANNQYVGTFSMPFKLNGSNCVMAGDQLPFWIQATSQITVQTRVDGSSDAAVTTSTPVRGINFRAGGDGFGGTSVQNTVTVNGSPVTVQTLQFYMCDANNSCTNRLMDMTKGSNNNGYYFTPNNVNTIPVVSYASAGINSADSFYNGNPNPILVKMLDGSSNVLRQVRLKIRGGFISASEMNAITLPSVTNAQTVLSTNSTLANPSLNINIPSGIVVQGLSLASGPMTGQVTSTSKYVMGTSTSSFTISRTIDSSSDYRSLQMNANTTSGTPISIKYVWSPTCTGCT